jgi:tetratricopeptide (TPR) repeat protein
MAKSNSKQKSSAATAPWLYNPWLDLIVGCGAWSAPLLGFSYFAGSQALTWSVAFYALALVFNYPHYMATLYRAYHTAEDFRKYRIFTVHLTALVVLTLLVGHFWYAALPWIFTVYLTWSPWHYSGQNYGLFMMFARRAGAEPAQTVRRALYAAFLLSYLVLALSFHTGPSSDPLFLSLGLPARASSAALIVLAAAFVAVSGYGIPRLARQTGWKPLLPSLTLFSTQFVWFLLPTALSFAKGLPVAQSRYSNGVFAIMHSAQYLWVTSYYARREAKADETTQWRPLAYFAVLIVGGIALFIPGPWLASRVFHYDFGASFLFFTALVNIHHFILDGAIWKLRDGRIAALLLNSRQQISQATSEAGNRVLAAGAWLAGKTSGARLLRVGTALALLMLGIVDQTRYYWALHQENLDDLQRAAALNAFDSTLQLHLGRRELEAGRADDALAAWQQAVQANPAEAAPRDQLLKYLTANRQLNQAYVLSGDSLRYTPRDVELLVNHGVLAEQLGHFDEAAASWKKAVAIDPAQQLAHLYLAHAVEREGKLDEAIPHYMTYLERIAKTGPEKRPRPEDVIAIVLRLAQCQQKAGHPEAAAKSFELAQHIAAQVGQKKLESFAAASEAALQSDRKNVPAALRSYQRALTLDAAAGDAHSEAVDWYNYALFLRDAGFPERLTYACLVKSQGLMKSANDEAGVAKIAGVREAMEKTLPEAPQLKRNSQTAIQEAINLTAP